MTNLATPTTSPAQTWASVLRAELGRHLGGRRFVVVVAMIAVAGVIAGLGMLAFVAAFDSEGTNGAASSVPAAIEMAGGVVALLFGMNALATAAAETTDGTVLSSLLLVPDRTRLLGARAVAPMLVGAFTGVIAASVVLACGFALAGGGVDLARGVAALIATTVAVPLTALLGFLTGTLVRRGAASMAAAMVALFVLPLAVGAAQLTAPAGLSPLLGAAIVATPGVAVLQSVSVTASQTGTVPPALTGLGVLAAWVVLVGIGARSRFAREGRNA